MSIESNHAAHRSPLERAKLPDFELPALRSSCYPLLMPVKITPRTQNFPQWYQDVLSASKDLYDESPVTGAITFGPLSTKLWANIRSYLDTHLKSMGVENIMLPMLIPESFFTREKEHIEGFAPEVAVVTHAGGAKLPEPYYVRPTSELLFVDWYGRNGKIQSHRDLPLLVNQWCSVMRWEKRPRAFLRTSEFHWQEGHCLFADEASCKKHTLAFLDLYATLCEELLAIPVIKGEKPEHERFPGAIATYTMEGMMQDGKALQMGTSHMLSQNFLKDNDGTPRVSFLNEDGKQTVPYYDSWGVSTRLLGAVFMSHGDDDGLVLPPALAPVSAAILPILAGDSKENETLRSEARKLAGQISGNKEAPYALHGREHMFEEVAWGWHGDGVQTSVRIDQRDETRLGDKTFHQIHEGTPVRIELGKKELAEGVCIVKSRIRSRDDAKKVPLSDAAKTVATMLKEDQATLLERAKERMEKNTLRTSSYKDIKEALAAGKWVEMAWDGTQKTVEQLKAETSGGTIRCFAFDAQDDATKEKDPLSGKPSAFAKRVLVGKAY